MVLMTAFGRIFRPDSRSSEVVEFDVLGSENRPPRTIAASAARQFETAC